MDELVSHALIGFDRETASARALRERGVALHRGMFALRADSDLAQLAAIRAGFGIGVCQTGLGRRDKELVHLLPELFALGRLETYVVMHEDLRASLRCRVVFDAMVEGLSSYIATTFPARPSFPRKLTGEGAP
jgi:DNA-binding transcriptional LysR family regulator